MATTNAAFVQLTAAQLVGSTVAAAGAVVAMNETSATTILETSSVGTRLDTDVKANLATAGYTKNGAVAITLSGTTPKTIDLTDLTASTPTGYAGDTTFASFKKLVFFNTGAADVTIAQGGSNPASLGFAGTTPTLTVPAGAKVTIESIVAIVVDSTHKNITVTPTAGGSFALCVGGA